MKYRVGHISKAKKYGFAGLTIRAIFPEVLQRHYNVLHEHLPKGTVLPHVRHRRTSELVFCLEGSFQVILNKKKFSLRKGSVVWIPPGTWHTFISNKRDATALSIFSPALKLNGKPDVETRRRA